MFPCGLGGGRARLPRSARARPAAPAARTPRARPARPPAPQTRPAPAGRRRRRRPPPAPRAPPPPPRPGPGRPARGGEPGFARPAWARRLGAAASRPPWRPRLRPPLRLRGGRARHGRGPATSLPAPGAERQACTTRRGRRALHEQSRARPRRADGRRCGRAHQGARVRQVALHLCQAQAAGVRGVVLRAQGARQAAPPTSAAVTAWRPLVLGGTGVRAYAGMQACMQSSPPRICSGACWTSRPSQRGAPGRTRRGPPCLPPAPAEAAPAQKDALMPSSTRTTRFRGQVKRGTQPAGALATVKGSRNFAGGLSAQQLRGCHQTALNHAHRCGRRVRVLGARGRAGGRVPDDRLPRARTQRSHAPGRAGACGSGRPRSPGRRSTGHAGTCGGGLLWSSSSLQPGVTPCRRAAPRRSSCGALSRARRCAARLGVDADDGGHLAQRGLVRAHGGQAGVQRPRSNLLEHAAQRARLVVVRAVRQLPARRQRVQPLCLCSARVELGSKTLPCTPPAAAPRMRALQRAAAHLLQLQARPGPMAVPAVKR